MKELNDFLNENSFWWVSAIAPIIYAFVHIAYDIITKSDIEKSLTYRGKDRIFSGFILFALYFLLVLMVNFESFLKATRELNIWIALLISFFVTLLLFLIVIFILGVVHIILIRRRFYPQYEVKLYNEKDEYWLILKVTKDNRVILKRNDEYLTLSNIKEIDNKIIRKHVKLKK